MTEFILLEELESKIYNNSSKYVPLRFVGFAIELYTKCNEYKGCCDNCKYCETASPFDPLTPEFLKDCNNILRQIENIDGF